jgi:integrase
MARQIHRLTAIAVKGEKRPGLYSDGGGLYLRVSPAETKSWIYRFALNKKKRDMGLGPYPLISLAEARVEAERCRKLCFMGIDPIEQRDKQKYKLQADAAKTQSFKSCAEKYIRSHSVGWKSPKQAPQWENSLSSYAYPHFGELPVQAVDIALVMSALEPIWAEKPETASRVRSRIEAVLDWAKARKMREGENPARWKGNLDALLPARSKVRRIKHFEALPYHDMPKFMTQLREQASGSSLGLELLILTACRTGEIRKAVWDEFDLGRKLWTLPPERMKAGREHRVPLSDYALAILNKLKIHERSKYILPGRDQSRPISDMTFLKILHRMGHKGLTVHGFRSTFRDWAAEQTDYQGEVAEMALSHAVGDKVEAAYRRGDLFDKRVQLMEDWAAYCAGRGKV